MQTGIDDGSGFTDNHDLFWFDDEAWRSLTDTGVDDHHTPWGVFWHVIASRRGCRQSAHVGV